MKLKKLFFIFTFLVPSISIAQENFLCVSEALGGVAYDKTKKRWEGTKFTNTNQKIIISKKNDDWKIREFEDGFERNCGKITEHGILRCDVFFGEFVFNINTKRFLQSYMVGYINGEDNNNNTPAVTIGTCGKF